MKLLWFLFRTNRRKTLEVMILGLLSGLASAGLIALVNSALYAGLPGSHTRWMIAVAFVVAVVTKVSSSLASSLILRRSVQDILLRMCTRLCRRVAETPFRKLEEIGAPRVMACLTDDIDALSAAIQVLPSLIVNLAILTGCAIYLAWISWTAALALVILVALLGVTYRILMVKAMAAVQRARDGRDTLFRHFRTLVEGIKELKLHGERRNTFFQEDVDTAAEYLRKENMTAMNRYAVADGWSQSMFYALLGVVVFAFPALQQVSMKLLTAYVFIALYTMGPLWGIIYSIPNINRGQISLEKLEQLGLALCDVATPAQNRANENSAVSDPRRTPPLIEFQDVTFRYVQGGDGDGFVFGPINLVLQPGELVFIIGGNGSGKSTLAKLLTGLYAPDSGRICIDGSPASAEDSDAYRQLFSAVFSDFYLFDRLLGLGKVGRVQAKAREYLVSLELSHKVKIDGNCFSTTALSQGQRRRLALLAAYLEDRPIYVLDEWAADQDPGFREIFYLKLLPELRNMGKTVVVITHDDRYFHLGDRVVKLDYGKVIDATESAAGAAYLRS
jgi:putative ATP-binding cassette transporter